MLYLIVLLFRDKVPILIAVFALNQHKKKVFGLTIQMKRGTTNPKQNVTSQIQNCGNYFTTESPVPQRLGEEGIPAKRD